LKIDKDVRNVIATSEVATAFTFTLGNKHAFADNHVQPTGFCYIYGKSPYRYNSSFFN
jgi:glyoxylate utilization-related uncharacterized protein